ncbi:hypothetical protein BT96DRAFT_950198 [Gymnopus androsaceus JB14]|uniref:Uncharacterized protein n=1 Tax=Gymnopus androsaceus JB14 TaxID=1447944 RepID=A0A6A4GHX1_9AGAR|nr:hypothetical protein BT96DRAFT_950198 [Gymnopus androsaceus JB14]
MHLPSLNIPDLFIPLWRGKFDCDKTDDCASWDWAVLKGTAWTQTLLLCTLKNGSKFDSTHGIFGDELWTHSSRFLDRLKWFMTLVPDLNNGKEMQDSRTEPNEPTELTLVARPLLANLLNPERDVTMVVRPLLANLLNPERDAYCDLLEGAQDKLHLDSRPEDGLDTDEPDSSGHPMVIDQHEDLPAPESRPLNYNGPVALSCDDTKAFAALHLYSDAQEKKSYLVGGTDGPILVPDPETVSKFMNDTTIGKGTKVCLWMLQIPLPKMPPIIAAAIPINDMLKVPQLLEFHKTIVFGLLDQNIKIISYACDGTKAECTIQRAFVELAESHIEVDIPSPHEGIASLHIWIPVFRSHPMAMIQDSKHALKTFRNNLFSGACLLVMGNHVAFYQQIRDIAFEKGSPLYHRDVDKLDHQDDNAASQLFSTATLQFLSEHHPEQLGVAIYLFVFGELCDAYQNQNINHSERINILLRLRYFINMLEQYIDKMSCYKVHQNALSREAVDIISFLVNGLISLIIIHRNYFPHIPLLPWMHSSEACEHTFGLGREIISKTSQC